MNGYRRLFSMAISIAAILPAIDHVLSRVHGQTQAESLAASFRTAAERVAPAVVAVRPLDPVFPLTAVPSPMVRPIRPFGAGPRLSFRVGEADSEPMGSGVVVDAKNGYILTNDHVLLGSSQAVVVLADGRERMVSQVRRDPAVDLAVLVIDPAGLSLTQAKLGNPNSLHPGDWVVSVGQAGGTPASLSSGIFSSRRRGAGTPALSEEWLETDAAVNSLNSGGPLVNLAGEVVGINTTQTGRRAQVAGMGFALPIDRARRVAADLINFGRVRRAFLGVHIEPAQPSAPGRPTLPGSVLIASVTPGTPAAEAGFRPGDVVVAVAGRPVAGAAMLQGLIETAPIGENLTVTIERGGQRQDLVVRPQAQPVTAAPGAPLTGPRVLPDSRQDPLRGRVRGGAPPVGSPRASPPLPPQSPGDDVPSALEPIPRTEQPAAGPSLEVPKNQPPGSPE
jgi:serine protease Do